MISTSTPGASSVPSTSVTRPTGFLVAVGQARQLDDDDVAQHGAALFLRRHVHVHDDSPVERHDEAQPGLVPVVATDDDGGAALQNPDDPALCTLARSPALEPCTTTRSPCIAWFRLAPAM